MNIAYTRVSTEEQAICGTSLEVQKDRILAYAVALGYEIDEVVVDAGYSAKDIQRRPGAVDLLARVERGDVASVTVMKLDRLTRSVRDLGTLVDLFNRKGVKLVSVTENLDTTSASGRMFINMVGVFSQWERETIGERTATALEHRREQRRVYGPTPYGWARHEDGTLREQSHQIVTLRDMQAKRQAGWSYRSIAQWLNGSGIPPSRGKKWYDATVHGVLTSKMAASLTS